MGRYYYRFACHCGLLWRRAWIKLDHRRFCQTKMTDLWQSFLVEFCKVQSVCWQGDPNWLGWIAIAVGALVAIWLLLIVGTIAWVAIT